MKKQIQITWECPGCLGKNKLNLPRPTMFANSHANVECDYCGSTGRLRCARHETDSKRVGYEFTMFTPSPRIQAKLDQLRRDGAEFEKRELTKENLPRFHSPRFHSEAGKAGIIVMDETSGYPPENLQSNEAVVDRLRGLNPVILPEGGGDV